jgi:hypothetical protein
MRNSANINVDTLVSITHASFDTTLTIDNPTNMADDRVGTKASPRLSICIGRLAWNIFLVR